MDFWCQADLVTWRKSMKFVPHHTGVSRGRNAGQSAKLISLPTVSSLASRVSSFRCWDVLAPWRSGYRRLILGSAPWTITENGRHPPTINVSIFLRYFSRMPEIWTHRLTECLQHTRQSLDFGDLKLSRISSIASIRSRHNYSSPFCDLIFSVCFWIRLDYSRNAFIGSTNLLLHLHVKPTFLRPDVSVF